MKGTNAETREHTQYGCKTLSAWRDTNKPPPSKKVNKRLSSLSCFLSANSTEQKTSTLRWKSQISVSTYTPGHEVGEAPVILLVEEQMTDPAAEGLLVVFVVDDLQHGLCVTWPWPAAQKADVLNPIGQSYTTHTYRAEDLLCLVVRVPETHQKLLSDSCSVTWAKWTNEFLRTDSFRFY